MFAAKFRCLFLQAAWEEPGRNTHRHHLKLFAGSWKHRSSLNSDTDREGAGQLSGSPDAEGKGRGRNL